jgi:hypothetical protein
MSSNLAYDNQSAGPTRQPEVSVVMDVQAMRCKALEEQITVLEDRLQPVLAQHAEKGGGETKPPEPVRVPLAQRIHEHSSHLSRLSDRLQSIINRIEL